jgi:hypothetical protein
MALEGLLVIYAEINGFRELTIWGEPCKIKNWSI